MFLCPWNSPGKNTGVCFHALLQGIFPTPGSDPGLPNCRRILYRLNHQGSPYGVPVKKIPARFPGPASVMSTDSNTGGGRHWRIYLLRTLDEFLGAKMGKHWSSSCEEVGSFLDRPRSPPQFYRWNIPSRPVGNHSCSGFNMHFWVPQNCRFGKNQFSGPQLYDSKTDRSEGPTQMPGLILLGRLQPPNTCRWRCKR